MTPETWNYPPELADALLTFGLKPTSITPPRLVRDALSDLYRYEIRRLKRRLLDGAVAKEDYINEVIKLRKKYWPLALQPEHWETICKPGDL